MLSRGNVQQFCVTEFAQSFCFHLKSIIQYEGTFIADFAHKLITLVHSYSLKIASLCSSKFEFSRPAAMSSWRVNGLQLIPPVRPTLKITHCYKYLVQTPKVNHSPSSYILCYPPPTTRGPSYLPYHHSYAKCHRCHTYSLAISVIQKYIFTHIQKSFSAHFPIFQFVPHITNMHATHNARLSTTTRTKKNISHDTKCKQCEICINYDQQQRKKTRAFQHISKQKLFNV